MHHTHKDYLFFIKSTILPDVTIKPMLEIMLQI